MMTNDLYNRYLCMSNIKRQVEMSEKIKEFIDRNMVYTDLHESKPIGKIKFEFMDGTINIRLYNEIRHGIKYIAAIFFSDSDKTEITIIHPYTYNIIAESLIPDVCVDYVLTELECNYMSIGKIVINYDTEKGKEMYVNNCDSTERLLSYSSLSIFRTGPFPVNDIDVIGIDTKSIRNKNKMKEIFIQKIKSYYKDFSLDVYDILFYGFDINLQCHLMGVFGDYIGKEKENNPKDTKSNSIQLIDKGFEDNELYLVYKVTDDTGIYIKTYKNLPLPINEHLLPFLSSFTSSCKSKLISYLEYEQNFSIDEYDNVLVYTKCIDRNCDNDTITKIKDKFGYIVDVEEDGSEVDFIYNSLFDCRDIKSIDLIDKGFEDNELYMVYKIKTDTGTYERKYSNVPLPINESKLPKFYEKVIENKDGITTKCVNYLNDPIIKSKSEFGLEIGTVDIFTEYIEKYITEMTIEEIEEELGYRIKIVDKKGN